MAGDRRHNSQWARSNLFANVQHFSASRGGNSVEWDAAGNCASKLYWLFW